MKYAILLSAVLLGGCVHNLPKTVTPQHHVARPTVKPAPKPVVTVAPAPPVVTPSPKQTFRRRWLHLFFRDRATSR
ncbi:MAG: hypothetical protein JWP25_4670 [Bradyrhizobium sp.]|nr:hypothetical protein [Bradyrhizobium sp.]